MYLLDTNVIFELRKIRSGKADKKVAAWADRVDASELYLSVISIQELEIGTMLVARRDAAQGKILRTWLNEYVLPVFFGRILEIDTMIAQRSAALHVPDPRPVRVTFIAATALVHGMTVVTRNESDFVPTNVPILNPWFSND